MNELGDWKWALVGIVIIALIYEINAKVGLALFIVVAMAMVYTYFSKHTVSWTEVIPK